MQLQEGDGEAASITKRRLDKRYPPIIRLALAGHRAQQDLAFEAALPLYDRQANMIVIVHHMFRVKCNHLKPCWS